MIIEFVDFCKELFPSISPYTAERTIEAIKQFHETGRTVEYLTKIPFDNICQGDIFDNVPFETYNDNGVKTCAKLKAQILTNTCDCEHDKYLTFAAIFPIAEFPHMQETIRKNIAYQFMYMPDKRVEDFVIDFSLLTTIPRVIVNKAMEMKKITRLASLSQMGYYLFLTKLTVFFMRPEDKGINESRVKQ